MDRVLFKERKGVLKVESSSENGRVISGIVSIGIIVLSCFLIFNSLRSIQITREKMNILNQAQEEVTNLRLKNIQLILQKETIETDDYTETDIRNRLNHSKKGEIIFVINEQVFSESLKKVEEILNPNMAVAVKEDVWEQWYNLIVNGI